MNQIEPSLRIGIDWRLISQLIDSSDQPARSVDACQPQDDRWLRCLIEWKEFTNELLRLQADLPPFRNWLALRLFMHALAMVLAIHARAGNREQFGRSTPDRTQNISQTLDVHLALV